MFRKTNLPESLFNKVTRLYAAILTEKNGILRDILENLFTEHHHMTATALQKIILPISSKETYLLFIRETTTHAEQIQKFIYFSFLCFYIENTQL